MKTAKTGAERQKNYRMKIKAMEKPENYKKAMLAAYMLGFAHSAQGIDPREDLGLSDFSLSYLCGGLDEILSN